MGEPQKKLRPAPPPPSSLNMYTPSSEYVAIRSSLSNSSEQNENNPDKEVKTPVQKTFLPISPPRSPRNHHLQPNTGSASEDFDSIPNKPNFISPSMSLSSIPKNISNLPPSPKTPLHKYSTLSNSSTTIPYGRQRTSTDTDIPYSEYISSPLTQSVSGLQTRSPVMRPIVPELTLKNSINSSSPQSARLKTLHGILSPRVKKGTYGNHHGSHLNYRVKPKSMRHGSEDLNQDGSQRSHSPQLVHSARAVLEKGMTSEKLKLMDLVEEKEKLKAKESEKERILKQREEEYKNIDWEYWKKIDQSRLIICQKYIRVFIARNEKIKAENQHSKRTLIANEMLSTEQTYVSNLQILVKSFLHPLREICNSNNKQETSSGNNVIITSSDLKTIFSEIEVIVGYNTLILTQLTQRLTKWSPSTKLADIFLKMAEFLKTYTQYAINYNKALTTLNRLRKASPEFEKTLIELTSKANCGKFTIRDFLIMPIQRIPRYQMLLLELVKKTPNTHGDYSDLKSASEKITKVAEYVNEHQEAADNLNKVMDLGSNFVGKKSEGLPLVAPHRRFVRSGNFTVDSKPFTLFLFNDLLIWGELKKKDGTYSIKRIDVLITLFDVSEAIMDAGEIEALELVFYGGGGNFIKTLIVPTSDISPSELGAWFEDLSNYQTGAKDMFCFLTNKEDIGSDPYVTSDDYFRLLREKRLDGNNNNNISNNSNEQETIMGFFKKKNPSIKSKSRISSTTTTTTTSSQKKESRIVGFPKRK